MSPVGVFAAVLCLTPAACGQPGPAETPAAHATASAAPLAAAPLAGNEPESAPAAHVPDDADPTVSTGIGTESPTTLLAASPRGDWVAMCQARVDSDGDGRLEVRIVGHGEAAGDRLSHYYVERGGGGFAIDAFVGNDPSGRFVAFIRGGRLVLRDTHAQLDVDLSASGADPRQDLAAFLPHRAGSFHPDGGRFAYLRPRGKQTTVIVRDLVSGTETAIDPGPGSVWRAEFEPDGAYLRISVVPRDSNGDKKLTWPVPLAPDGLPCPLPVPRHAVPGREPDRLSTLLHRVADGKLLERDGLVTTVGESVLLRDPDQRLLLEAPDGARREVAPKECLGRVLHAFGPSASVLVGCATEFGQRRRLYLSTREKFYRLGYEVAAFEGDGRYPHQPRHLLLEPGNESILVDMVTARVTKVTPGTKLLASHGGLLLVERKGQLYWMGSQGTERALGVRRPSLARVFQSGPYVTLGALWFDLEGAKGPVQLPREPLGLVRTGAVLLGQRESEAGIWNGPLEWLQPAHGVAGDSPRG